MLDSMMIVSDRAARVLERVSDTELVEWISAEHCGTQWWVVRVNRVVDAVDEGASAIRRLPSGLVAGVEKLVLKRDGWQHSDIFRLARGLQTFGCFVSADLMQAWADAGLRGMRFIPVEVGN
jgi:hypothetical protein